MASIARLDVLTWPTFGSTFGSLVLSMVFGSLVSWMGLARAHSFTGGSLLTLPAGWQITDMAWIWPGYGLLCQQSIYPSLASLKVALAPLSGSGLSLLLS